ncbi:hypothetical protein E2C01_048790 [Portunus trituberculatus]|uniref:Uncharacterized protein n=1 Tax=Portunus trituberculatus TaxID=210409 RepID=A0A5B7G4N2_PORTR|nr:hypothetical protein [Portunus trituberculatus]
MKRRQDFTAATSTTMTITTHRSKAIPKDTKTLHPFSSPRCRHHKQHVECVNKLATAAAVPSLPCVLVLVPALVLALLVTAPQTISTSH